MCINQTIKKVSFNSTNTLSKVKTDAVHNFLSQTTQDNIAHTTTIVMNNIEQRRTHYYSCHKQHRTTYPLFMYLPSLS